MKQTETNLEAQIFEDSDENTSNSNNIFSVRNIAIGSAGLVLLAAGGATYYYYHNKSGCTKDELSPKEAEASAPIAPVAPANKPDVKPRSHSVGAGKAAPMPPISKDVPSVAKDLPDLPEDDGSDFIADVSGPLGAGKAAPMPPISKDVPSVAKDLPDLPEDDGSDFIADVSGPVGARKAADAPVASLLEEEPKQKEKVEAAKLFDLKFNAPVSEKATIEALGLPGLILKGQKGFGEKARLKFEIPITSKAQYIEVRAALDALIDKSVNLQSHKLPKIKKTGDLHFKYLLNLIHENGTHEKKYFRNLKAVSKFAKTFKGQIDYDSLIEDMPIDS